jgi:hypothetical protein
MILISTFFFVIGNFFCFSQIPFLCLAHSTTQDNPFLHLCMTQTYHFQKLPPFLQYFFKISQMIIVSFSLEPCSLRGNHLFFLFMIWNLLSVTCHILYFLLPWLFMARTFLLFTVAYSILQNVVTFTEQYLIKFLKVYILCYKTHKRQKRMPYCFNSYILKNKKTPVNWDHPCQTA